MLQLRILLLSFAVTATNPSVFANPAAVPGVPTPAAPVVKPKRPGTEVVKLVNDTPDAALEKLNFVELYFLKNAVMANSGYDFANDRMWLSTYFAPEENAGSRACLKKDYIDQCQVIPICTHACKILDLSPFSFPAPPQNFVFKMTPDMTSALARIRQTQFKKLRSISDIGQIEPKLVSDLNALPLFKVSHPDSDCDICEFEFRFALGRPVRFFKGGIYSSEPDRNYLVESLVRDLKGDLSLLELVEQFKKDNYEFDLAELLGLYLGNLDLLRKVILARSGRTFEEPLKTELKQMGVEPAGMSVGNLSPASKEALRRIDVAIEKLTQGQLNDVPESMKAKALDFSDLSLSYSAAM